MILFFKQTCRYVAVKSLMLKYYMTFKNYYMVLHEQLENMDRASTTVLLYIFRETMQAVAPLLK